MKIMFQEGVRVGHHFSPFIHRKKSFSMFPSPARMSLTKLSLSGNNDVIYKLISSRESLVSDIPAGDGNIEKHFLQWRLKMCLQVLLRQAEPMGAQ